MKKLLFAFAAMFGLGLISCGNDSTASKSVDSVSIDTVDSIIADSIN